MNSALNRSMLFRYLNIKLSLKSLFLSIVLAAILLRPLTIPKSEPARGLMAFDMRFSPNGEYLLLDGAESHVFAGNQRSFTIFRLNESGQKSWDTWNVDSDEVDLKRAVVTHFDNQRRVVLEAWSRNHLAPRVIHTYESDLDERKVRNANETEKRIAIANGSNRHFWSLRDLQSATPSQVKSSLKPIANTRLEDTFWFAWRTSKGDIFQIWKRLDPSGSIVVAKTDETGAILSQAKLDVKHTAPPFKPAVTFAPHQNQVFTSADCRYFVVRYQYNSGGNTYNHFVLFDEQLNEIAKDFGHLFQFSQNGKYLASFSRLDDRFRIIRLRDGQILFNESIEIPKLQTFQLPYLDSINQLAVGNNGRKIAIAFDEKPDVSLGVLVFDTDDRSISWRWYRPRFPYWTSFVLLVIWGVFWGRFALHPAKVPVGRQVSWTWRHYVYAIFFQVCIVGFLFWMCHGTLAEGWMLTSTGLAYAFILMPLYVQRTIATES